MINDKQSVKKITEVLNIDYHTYLHESKILYLENKIKEIKTQKFKIAGKYNITSIVDFENLYKNGKLEEHATLEDFKEMDRLEYIESNLQLQLTELRNG